MAYATIAGSKEMGSRIKNQRKALGLTIEEAARRAHVGTKTWCRYESGEAIRADKWKGVCKALNWMQIENAGDEHLITLSECKKKPGWSSWLDKTLGKGAAASFAIGSEMLLDKCDQDLQELAAAPKGTHLGEIGCSLLADILPEQFLVEYDYDFVYAFRATLKRYLGKAKYGTAMTAHSVMDELVIYLAIEESSFFQEEKMMAEGIEWDEWAFDLFDDMDIVTYLYSDMYVAEGEDYHFDNWMKEQFYQERES